MASSATTTAMVALLLEYKDPSGDAKETWLTVCKRWAAAGGFRDGSRLSQHTRRGTSGQLPAQTDVLERSRLQLLKPPHAAAECIAENARAAGVEAQMLPLYGYESVGVVVTSRLAGDHVAVFALTRRDGGARSETTTWANVPDREALLRRLTQGC